MLSCSKSTPISSEHSYPSLYADKAYLKRLNFQGRDLIYIFNHNQYYYIRPNGKMMPTLTYNNRADKFVDGLARTKMNGKIGFFNRNLEIVLKPVYDFAFPFHNGVAEICIGCQEIDDGEHSILEGGEWKKIDRTGLLME